MLKIQLVPRSEHIPSRLYRANRLLMLYREIKTLFVPKQDTEHSNVLCGQNIKVLMLFRLVRKVTTGI
jgi:hypothetical protein